MESVGRRTKAVAEAARLEEASRSDDLVVRDESLGGVRVGRSLDRVRVAERLGADEEEGSEGRLHASQGEADCVGREPDAPEGNSPLSPRARVRERLELDILGKVA